MTAHTLRRAAARLVPGLLLLALAAPRPVAAETRLMRQPDIHGNTIVFVYGGDLWTVDRTGGAARRLTTDIGVEVYPMFSPDGQTVAFSAEYDGNLDLFTIPVTGGEPKRLTWHPMPDRACAWYPDGKSIMVRSVRQSDILRFDRFFKVPIEGGFAEVQPLPIAGPACWSSDGQKLVYDQPSMENRTWKRYQGGSAPDVWIYDFKAGRSEKITDWTGSDEFPMWYGDTIYFNSDRTGKLNIWAYDLKTKTTRQVTKFDEFDVKWPSIGPDGLVFENGGWLYVLDLPSEKLNKLTVTVPTDNIMARAEYRSVAGQVRGADISPSAKRVAVEARGDIYTVPARKGTWRNLTETPGSHERSPAWSPDGRWIACWSDASSEYQIELLPQDGAGPAKSLTHFTSGYGFRLVWSPDSKKLAWSDQTGTLFWMDAAGGAPHKVDKCDIADITDYVWSPDSKWLTYSKALDNYYSQIALHEVATGRTTMIGDGTTDDVEPVFDPEGKILAFRSQRHLDPSFGNFDNTWIFDNTSGLYAITLTKDGESPVKVESDEETPKADDKADKGGDAKKGGDKKDAGKKDEEKGGGDEAAPVKIDLDNLAARTAKLPVDPGNYAGLTMVKGKLVYLSRAASEIQEDVEDQGGAWDLMFYDFEEREAKTILSGVTTYAPTADGSKLLVKAGRGWGIVDVAADQKIDEPVPVDGLQALVDPKAEWKDMFVEAWRHERDFFYQPSMHGLDWTAIRRRYEPLAGFCAHRSDLNYLLGEMIAELNCSHAYVWGGDYPKVPRVGVGLLGADYELDAASGRYRFQRVFRQSEWNQDVLAPLGQPGIDVKGGDYLLSVDGKDVRAPHDVFEYFQNTADRPVQIRVNSRPDTAGSKVYLVEPVGSESDLRYTAWVDGNRRKVEEATGGRAGYLHIPDTGIRGHVEFSKGFYRSIDKEAIVVDGRYNGGGFIPDEMIQKLARKPLGYFARRDYRAFRSPGASIDGPKVFLTNEYAGSGGDALPYYFRAWGLGPVVGKRTWGGLVGISRDLPMIDGGIVTMPDIGFFSLDGKWAVENHGVDVDFDIDQLPELVIAGHDPQLEKGIELVREALAKNPPKRPAPPAAPDRSGVQGPKK